MTIKSSEKRREESNNLIKQLGITCYENLSLVEDQTQVALKNPDKIAKRAIASLLSIQLACDIGNNVQDIKKSKDITKKLLNHYDVYDELLESEKALFLENPNKQNAINVVWTYEAYWALVWALGLVEDIGWPNKIVDGLEAIKLLQKSKDYEDFKSKIKMRDIEEVLDKLDLFYRLHWACVNKRIDSKTEIKDLNPEVVMERRRGLEWLVSPLDDWNEIPLHT